VDAEKLKIYKAFSDETRYRILSFLLTGEKPVHEITVHCNRAQSTISLQLKKLEHFNLVSWRRDGKRILYRISHEKLQLVHRLI
jgi:ArsR family transcriptional regulator, lead/cadmium/zinc/bismuth-responsive transcriptional repressor